MAVANTLAYYDMATITVVKSFTVEAQAGVKKWLHSYWNELIERAGNTNIRGRLSTVDLLIKVACFVKKQWVMSALSKAVS